MPNHPALFPRNFKKQYPIAASGEGSPHFGPAGTVWFRYSDGKANFIGLMNKDGSARRQVIGRPITTVMACSPDGRWLVAMAPARDGGPVIDTIAIPADGTKPRVIGRGRHSVAWSRDGRFIYIGFAGKRAGQTLVFSGSQQGLPDLPEGGIRSDEQASVIRGARLINASEISPGPDPSTFAYVKTTTQRNLFRIPLQ